MLKELQSQRVKESKSEGIFFLFLFSLILLMCPMFVHAAGADLRMDPGDIRFSKTPLVAGDHVRIYTKIKNVGTVDVTGYVSFYQGSSVIGDPQVISVVVNGDPEEAFVDFDVPSEVFNIRAVISGTIPVDVNLDNNIVVTGMFTPVLDDDHDGIPNATDNCLSVANPDQLNTDHDSLGNACDDDMDGDGLSNEVESELGTNALVIDTDKDGADDAHDAYPLDPKRSVLEKVIPVVAAKPIIKQNTQVKLVAETDASTKTPLIDSPLKSPADLSNGIAETTMDTTAPVSADSSKANVSSNAVFTYEKSSWNTFSFRVIAPVQDHWIYEWDFGDGVRSSKTTVDHTYTQIGTYRVSLKTSNDKGEVKNESAEVEISFFSFSNPWLIGLVATLALALIGSFVALLKMKTKKRIDSLEEDTPLKQIHVKEE